MAKAPPLYQYNINSENDKEKQLLFCFGLTIISCDKKKWESFRVFITRTTGLKYRRIRHEQEKKSTDGVCASRAEKSFSS